MIKLKLNGKTVTSDNLAKELEKSIMKSAEKSLSQKLGTSVKINQTNHIEFAKIFTNSFMSKYTKFKDQQSFFEAVDYKNSDIQKIDAFVKENSDFDTFEKMKDKALQILFNK